MVNVSEIIFRIMKSENLEQQQVAEKIFNKSKQSLNGQIKRNKLDWDVLFQWAINKKIDLNWLLTGQKTQNTKYESDLKNGAEDADFKNKYGDLLYKTKEILQSETEFSNSLAANINSFHNAMKNEKRIDLLERKVDLLEAENGRLKTKGLIEKRSGERRKNNMPVEIERRSGKDRRKSVL